MTIFRYKKNRLLYTITREGPRGGYSYKAHPYKHNVEIGVIYTSHSRYRDFKVGMSLKDFEVVAIA
jgi:hypothetical protein